MVDSRRVDPRTWIVLALAPLACLPWLLTDFNHGMYPPKWIALFLIVLAIPLTAAAVAWVRLREGGVPAWPVMGVYGMFSIPFAATALLPRCWGCEPGLADTFVGGRVVAWGQPFWMIGFVVPVVQVVLASPWIVALVGVAIRNRALVREGAIAGVVALTAMTGLMPLYDMPQT